MTAEISVPGYTVVKKLTDGGSASIYKARKHPYDTMVVLKVLLPQFVAAKDMVRAFERELSVLLRLHHPNVIRCGGAVKGAPRPAVELELFESNTVKTLIVKAGGKLGLRETARVLTQTAEALSYVHTMDIAHLDVKPDNILVDDKLSVRLIDFSIARDLKKTISDRLLGIFGAKGGDTLIRGTLTYLSPEQIRRTEPGAASDIYALGLVLHECLTGNPPFRGHDPKAIMKQHLMDAPPSLEQARPDAPPAVADLCRRMLEKDPGKRPDATSVAQALAKYAG